jgi:hypothetical protein
MRVFTESDVQAGIGKTNNYPFAGPNAVEALAWHSHPLYETAPFFVHDVGVVILKSPGVVLSSNRYGRLPSVDQLDDLRTQRGLKDTTFTAVGYGLQESFPDPASFLANNSRTRYVATPQLLQINSPGSTGDFSLLLSNNHKTGGTCFGDSGGLEFLRHRSDGNQDCCRRHFVQRQWQLRWHRRRVPDGSKGHSGLCEELPSLTKENLISAQFPILNSHPMGIEH